MGLILAKENDLACDLAITDEMEGNESLPLACVNLRVYEHPLAQDWNEVRLLLTSSQLAGNR